MTIPGGHLSGKWWGSKDIRPVLGVHGFLDNCGSFDKLIPLLPMEYSYLVFDLPGHGRSSEYASERLYSYFDLVILLERIRREFKWDKLSLMGHSFGAVLGFYYVALFPDKIDLVVAIDNFEPCAISPLVSVQRSMNAILDDDKRQLQGMPSKGYTFDQLLENRIRGSYTSLDGEPECAKRIVLRDVRRSPNEPGKFVFNYDMKRLKGINRGYRHPEDAMAYARNIKAPVLYLMGNDSFIRKYNPKQMAIVREFMVANCPDFTIKFGPGNHHFHMTHPQIYATDISAFLRKHRGIGPKL